MKVARLLLAILLAAPAALVSAEFHVWSDAEGRRRVSNLPPSQVAPDGTVRERFHPYGIAAQRARLRAELARRDAELIEETPLDKPLGAAAE
ncbi:MAG: hypothetical protein WD928_18500 [Gammaproteobacteria bacterium]